MTQNLDYDIQTNLYAETSDVESNITGLTVTGYTNATGVGEWGSNNAALKYYNPGLHVYTTPTEINYCGSVSDLSKCTNYGWKEYTPGDDEHYLAGNYYSWAAATAGTGNGITSGNAPGSICPKNWKLPLSGESNNGNSGSFYFLLNKYGLTSTITGTGLDGQDYNIASSPLYFLRGGNLTPTTLYLPGTRAPYWSRTTSSITDAYSLDFTSGVYPFSYFAHSRGNPIRCLADRSV